MTEARFSVWLFNGNNQKFTNILLIRIAFLKKWMGTKNLKRMFWSKLLIILFFYFISTGERKHKKKKIKYWSLQDEQSLQVDETRRLPLRRVRSIRWASASCSMHVHINFYENKWGMTAPLRKMAQRIWSCSADRAGSGGISTSLSSISQSIIQQTIQFKAAWMEERSNVYINTCMWHTNGAGCGAGHKPWCWGAANAPSLLLEKPL